MSLAQKILRLSPKWKPHILALAGVMGIVFVGMLGINAMFDKFRFEVKLDNTAQAALEQIAARGYAQPYCQRGKPIYCLGVALGTQQRAITEWLVEQIG